MKKIALICCLFAKLLFAEEKPTVQWMADIGNIMRQKRVNEIMFFEGARADNNKIVSSFVFTPQDKSSKEQIDVIEGLRNHKYARKEFVRELADENRDMLCKNKFLPRLKEIDLTYVYKFRFDDGDEIDEVSIRARECKN